MIVRIIRVYVSQGVKIFLIALILVLLEILKHDLTKFPIIATLSVIIERG